MSEESRITFGKLTHLLLGNFKAFKRTQRIPIRPITLIYGKNNSGKSSIIQALLYAEHARRTGKLDSQVIVKDNHRVLEGGLARLVYGHDKVQRPRFGWEWINPGNISGLISGQYEQELHQSDLVLTATLNGQPLVRLTDPDEGWMMPEPNQKHPSYRSALANVQHLLTIELRRRAARDESSFELRSILNSYCDDLEKGRYKPGIEDVLVRRFCGAGGLKFDERSLPPPWAFSSKQEDSWYMDLSLHSPGIRWTTSLAHGFEKIEREIRTHTGAPLDALTGSMKDSLEAYLETFFVERGAYLLYRWLEDVWAHFSAPLNDLVGTVHYLGAVRSRPETVFFRDPRDLATERKDRRARLAPQHPDWIFQPSAVERANRWLRANKLLTGSIELSYEESHPRESRGKPRREPAPAGVAATLSLYDRDRKVSLGFGEVGHGLSQFIPVLLACFARQNHYAHEPAGTLLVEEPEAHIHPALQSEIGDLFIEAVTRAELPLSYVVCETHSEHLLLRIMRRIREGKLSPSKVAVLYVENLGKESIVREMPLNEKGESIRDWPGGFFEEGLREVLD